MYNGVSPHGWSIMYLEGRKWLYGLILEDIFDCFLGMIICAISTGYRVHVPGTHKSDIFVVWKEKRECVGIRMESPSMR